VTLAYALGVAHLSKSTYEWCAKHRQQPKKPEDPDDIRISDEIRAIWLNSKKRYGYRKVAIELAARYHEKVNHKKVLRMMRKAGMEAVLCGEGHRYSSYHGTVGKIVPNLLRRDFFTTTCLQKAGTDVTEMKFPFGKVYFSPVIDFHNDEILAYDISMSPDMKLINDMLDMLFEGHPMLRNMVLHSDQGWQYQMKTYQRRLKERGIIQSMSRKGNCLDNSKTENLFSKMKKEMYYGHENEPQTFAEARKMIEEYVRWYNTERIVTRLGGAPVSNRSTVPLPLLTYSANRVLKSN
jgi:transposase InsO family protein